MCNTGQRGDVGEGVCKGNYSRGVLRCKGKGNVGRSDGKK